jgi:hypothetical protein
VFTSKIHKPDIPFRPVVSSVDSPFYVLAGFLRKILNTLIRNTDSFVKNSEKFIKLMQEMNLQNEEYLVSVDVSLFTNIIVEEVLQVI